MKRDMELVREVLKETAEARGTLDGMALVDDEHDLEDVAYHVEIMRQAGLVEGRVQRSGSGKAVNVVVGPPTWEGNDFLDAVSNDGVWRRVRSKVLKLTGSATFAVVKALAEKELSDALLGD